MKIREKLTVDTKPKSFNEIEKYIEWVCDYYNISDHYYGNILMAVTEMVRHINEENILEESKYDIEFGTEQENICFVVRFPAHLKYIRYTFERFNEKQDLIDPKVRRIFVIKSLCDEITFEIDGIKLIFKIEKITRESSKHRKKEIASYLNKIKQSI